jgi:integrase
MTNRINFTKAVIDDLPIPSPGSRDTYHDSKTAGLQLRITSAGIITFSLYRRIKRGSPERITLGRYPQMTIQQAREKAAEINLAIAKGANPGEIERGRKAESTFADLFNIYLERHSKLNKKTWRKDEQHFRQFLEKPLGKLKLSAIKRQPIASVFNSITMSGHPVVANRVLALVSSVYGWALSAGLWEHNPAKGIKRNKENSRDRFLQSDELPRFFQALAAEHNDTMRDYFLLALLTGARRSNVLSMEWADVNFDRAEWRIKETKNGTPQTVTLSPEALSVLRDRRPEQPSRFVFPGTGKTGHLAEPKKAWERVLGRAGIDDLRIHDLRRTLGSWQAKTGASLAIIGKSLNHKNQNTTAIYARLDLDPVRDSVNTATSAIMAAAGLKTSADVVKIGGKKG